MTNNENSYEAKRKLNRKRVKMTDEKFYNFI